MKTPHLEEARLGLGAGCWESDWDFDDSFFSLLPPTVEIALFRIPRLASKLDQCGFPSVL